MIHRRRTTYTLHYLGARDTVFKVFLMTKYASLQQDKSDISFNRLHVERRAFHHF